MHFAPLPVQSQSNFLRPDKVWSPLGILIIGLFTSTLASGVLHSINWRRLGDRDRFLPSVVTVVCMDSILVLILIFYASLDVILLTGLLNIGFCWYLYRNQVHAYRRFRSSGGQRASLILPAIACFLFGVFATKTLALAVLTLQIAEYESKNSRLDKAREYMYYGQMVQARACFDTLLTKDRLDTEVRFSLVRYYETTGSCDSALAELQHILDIDPGYQRAMNHAVEFFSWDCRDKSTELTNDRVMANIAFAEKVRPPRSIVEGEIALLSSVTCDADIVQIKSAANEAYVWTNDGLVHRLNAEGDRIGEIDLDQIPGQANWSVGNEAPFDELLPLPAESAVVIVHSDFFPGSSSNPYWALLLAFRERLKYHFGYGSRVEVRELANGRLIESHGIFGYADKAAYSRKLNQLALTMSDGSKTGLVVVDVAKHEVIFEDYLPLGVNSLFFRNDTLNAVSDHIFSSYLIQRETISKMSAIISPRLFTPLTAFTCQSSQGTACYFMSDSAIGRLASIEQMADDSLYRLIYDPAGMGLMVSERWAWFTWIPDRRQLFVWKDDTLAVASFGDRTFERYLLSGSNNSQLLRTPTPLGEDRFCARQNDTTLVFLRWKPRPYLP